MQNPAKPDRVRLVVADFAGTMTDFGSSAPAAAFVELFRRHGIEATDAEARVPMGLQKRDHVKTMLNMDSIARQWKTKHGKQWSEADLDALYAAFIPIQINLLPDYNDLIPGAKDAIASLKTRDIRVAGTTGYDRRMMNIVVGGIAEQGVALDAAVCAEEVSAGRPAPWMIFRAMEATGVSPPSAVVNIGDTLPDVEAGLHAGAWSIGVTDTGNMTGCDKRTWLALSEDERSQRRENAVFQMKNAGAHFVLEEIAQLPALIDQINERIQSGEKP